MLTPVPGERKEIRARYQLNLTVPQMQPRWTFFRPALWPRSAQNYAPVPLSLRDALLVEIFKQRDRILARYASQFLERGYVNGPLGFMRCSVALQSALKFIEGEGGEEQIPVDLNQRAAVDQQLDNLSSPAAVFGLYSGARDGFIDRRRFQSGLLADLQKTRAKLSVGPRKIEAMGA